VGEGEDVRGLSDPLEALEDHLLQPSPHSTASAGTTKCYGQGRLSTSLGPHLNWVLGETTTTTPSSLPRTPQPRTPASGR
jgi:hypothetical protein